MNGTKCNELYKSRKARAILCYTVNNYMRLQFNYPSDMSEYLCDTFTYCASVNLFLRGIHTSQLDHCTLAFEHARDLTYAQLLLSASTVYTVTSFKQ